MWNFYAYRTPNPETWPHTIGYFFSRTTNFRIRMVRLGPITVVVTHQLGGN